MKKKLILTVIIIVLICILGLFLFKSNATDSKIINTNQKTAEVSTQTIVKTLTTTGEVASNTMEKLTLNTSYYYLTMCAEEDQFVAKGDNLLEYTNGTYLVAPYDCVVMSYSLPNVKDICTSSNYVYIASLDDLYMDISISEEQINNIKEGQEVSIIANYDESKTYSGTITKINAIGTYASSGTTFAAIAKIENDGTLKLGMSANCTITIGKNDQAVCIPVQAVEIDDDERYVYLADANGNKANKVEVTTGDSNANYVEIKSGLSLGDVVYYEETTVTVAESTSETTENALTSLFTSNTPQGSGNFDKSQKMSRGGY